MSNDRNLLQLLELDVEDGFPTECEGDGGGAVGFMMRNAPTVLISRNSKLKNRIVPVYFIASRKNGENCSDRLLSKMYEGSGRLAQLQHLYEGKSLGNCIVIPFLYHMQPSARQFCVNIERCLNSKTSEMEIAWKLEYCRVDIMHNGNNHEPSDSIGSLTS